MPDAPYDSFAAAYHHWWGPVIAPSARQVLAPIADELDRQPQAHVVDIGVGTGTVALEVLRRWPEVRVTGVDVAGQMLAIAQREAEGLGRDVAGRLKLVVGDALRLPLADASADLALSTFVVQLVWSRAAMLREARRILRSGGTFASLTWLADDSSFEPDRAFDDALDELRIEPLPHGPDPRPYSTPRSAAAEVRRAGFGSVRAEQLWLEHRWDADSYAGLLENWAEEELFKSLAPPLRERLRLRIRERLQALPADAFVWRRPLTIVVGRADRR